MSVVAVTNIWSYILKLGDPYEIKNDLSNSTDMLLSLRSWI